MRFPQLIVYGRDPLLVNLLRPVAQARRWALREPRKAAACWPLLAGVAPAVLVFRGGREPDEEAQVLARLSLLYPEVATVAVVDAPDEPFADLAWDLGADFVLAPPFPPETLAGLVERLMAAAVARQPDAAAVPPPSREVAHEASP